MSTNLFMCHSCARYLGRRGPLCPGRPGAVLRLVYSLKRNSTSSATNEAKATTAEESSVSSLKDGTEPGAMSRRLEEATEEALTTEGGSGRRAVEEAGFSEELKNRLLSKIADAEFRSQYGRSIAAAGLDTVSMTASPTGAGSRDLAAAEPWTGEEATADAVLRMLDDARKPLPPGLRRKPRIPQPSTAVDLRLRRKPSLSPGQRMAAARDKAMVYTSLEKNEGGTDKKDQGLNENEREVLRKEFRDRFAPGARALPNTVAGLAALANERIEDAIARGQFRGIPRGPGVAAHDARADNPFVDTTEYLLNKMIQRQALAPPWIEKQQELVREAQTFRARLRTDWQRHAARMIASRSGPGLEAQLRQARAYARAEQVHNPRSQRSFEHAAVPTTTTNDPVMSGMLQSNVAATTSDAADASNVDFDEADANELTAPFRDPQWEATERAYLELAVAQLNALTRSYNLMAPELAKKPYFALDRELRACFADVAPTLADAIRERAARPAARPPVGDAVGRRVLERFAGEGRAGAARVYDSKAPHYGFKEMWRDLWKRPA
ncbi:hypothetical protein SPI_07780 [Niveomyces insectorum RCEF 264]|uniref:DnaJ homologue subfamily C member 28 conserved domain-containing protein n=1 Tax=Niveomyces insectorum RCEF 264 TaxID=1081102 RepID=A0A167P0Z8_9HYPO|nr:hypothetical protein SPI_07780 [Niveomyces insectorum RCEF 264]